MHQALTENNQPEARSRSYSLLEVLSLQSTMFKIPEHPKSKDFISDFTVAADSGGVGDALLRQTPCQRLAVSDSRESTSSAASLQGTNHSKVRAHRKCRHRLKVFIDSEVDPTMSRFNALPRIWTTLRVSGSFSCSAWQTLNH